MNKKEVIKYGIEVFNNEEDKFQRWLSLENKSIGNKKPFELLETEEGRNIVLDCLNRIEYGNFG